MKFLVDEMPYYPLDCPFLKEDYADECKIDGCSCYSTDFCTHLIPIDSIIGGMKNHGQEKGD